MSNISIKDFLNSLPKNEKIYYKTNPGNAGDALIATGAYQLFKKCNLNITSISSPDFDATNKVVIYAGGGNLVGIYPEARQFFENNHKKAKQLIMLPHTVTKNEDLLKTLGSNVTIFAREQVSYNHLLDHAKNANVYIDHDLAVYLNAHAIINSQSIGFLKALILKVTYRLLNNTRAKEIPSISIMMRNSIFELNSLFLKSKDTGIFFRDDVESLNFEVPKSNADLSKVYDYGTHSEEVTYYTTQRLMRYINHFTNIRTDRLHICIAAALLDKPVEFYPNSYFKCKAVYEYSLKDKFPNIQWVNKTNQ
ncbi:MAG: polysaccharide pyruvyl transferase family protein [Thiotrichaceae bacterium]|nr:polysaccharide pyruvyl transferase family protein [Thiotrichaceae bacterium]